jgi:signal transduction histidine kinase
VARALARGMDGDVTVETDDGGRGATFSVTLPRR